MKKETILATALLCGAPLAYAVHGSASAPRAAVAAAFDDFESLEGEFTTANEQFAKDLAVADRTKRREMRKNAPVIQFWPRFEALAKSGEGRASLWLANHVKDNKSIRSSDRGPVLEPLYALMFANDTEAEWFPEAVESLGANAKYVGKDASIALLDSVISSDATADSKAGALFFCAQIEDDEAKKKSYVDRIVADYANTVYGTAARALTAKPEDSRVGKTAPTFVGKTIDGFQFSLEDYRGKVVLLDFYGFW